MTTRFATLGDAITAGYRKCGAKYGDADTSGGSCFGYTYTAADGRESVSVYLTEARNHGGGTGAFVALMPLCSSVTAEAEAWAVTAANTEADIESGW